MVGDLREGEGGGQAVYLIKADCARRELVLSCLVNIRTYSMLYLRCLAEVLLELLQVRVLVGQLLGVKREGH